MGFIVHLAFVAGHIDAVDLQLNPVIVITRIVRLKLSCRMHCIWNAIKWGRLYSICLAIIHNGVAMVPEWGYTVTYKGVLGLIRVIRRKDMRAGNNIFY